MGISRASGLTVGAHPARTRLVCVAWQSALFHVVATARCHPEHREGSRCGTGVAHGRMFLHAASQACPVPCGCRRAGYFPLGESNQSRPRGGLRPAARGALRCSPGALSAFASCFAAKPGPRHPGACAQRMRCARRELAHPWARTGAPCSRARLRCSALANAGKVKVNGKVNGNSNGNSASMCWLGFLIFIPLRQRRDCAGKARSVSARTRSRAAGQGWPSARPAQARGPAQRALRSGSAFFGSFLCRPKERNPRGGSRTEQGNLAEPESESERDTSRCSG
jgi:hypothetical protein